ncbi:hypothetical protein ACJMK2_000749 [Sinanodonta woodiana]|uniref:PHD-type domain-containing protein n=1 Tax=Sinanodonta woodiana TaxID=1069815 RepID=A0ABD3XQB6_SINWO
MTEPATPEEQKRFIQSLAGLKKPCVGLSAFKEEYSGLFVSHGPGPTSTKLPPSFRSFYSANNESIEGVDLTKMCNSMYEQSHISDAQVVYVEEVTRNQSSSLVWHEQRVGRITASIAGDCLRTSLSNPSPSLIKKICAANEGPKRFPAVIWGTQHADDAFRMYTNMYTKSGPSPDHVPCGFADLIVCTPIDVIIVRVNRDIDFIHDMVKSLQMFWEKHILPELITRRFERNVQSECSSKADKEKMLSDNTKSYCVCENRTKLDDMVGCDHCDTWFHIKCIGLKSLPT